MIEKFEEMNFLKSALLLIDIQNDYFKGGKSELYRTEEAAQNAILALTLCRKEKMPIFHVQHINLSPLAKFFRYNTPGCLIHQSVLPLPSEFVVVKHVPNAFSQTDLHQQLKALEIEHLIICGMMTHMCIDTTVRAAQDYGYPVTLLQDACTTKDLRGASGIIAAPVVHDTFIAALNGTFARIVATSTFIESMGEEE